MNKRFLFFNVFVFLLLSACSSSQPEVLMTHSANQPDTRNASPLLKVMTLNLAHGRKDGFNQIFQSKSRIKRNLADIANVLKKHNADIVALQEADAPSWWSGDFNHVAWLAQYADYSAYIQSSHASSWFFSYGTGLLSRGPFTDTLKHTFHPSPPTLNKGFTLGQIAWQFSNKEKPVLLDILSVHLDFSRKSIREQQVTEIKHVLTKRRLAGQAYAMIIMGDFNSDWFAREKVIQALTEKGDFHVYKPEAHNLGTYKSTHRLDWIIISKELDFKSMNVLPDVLSDHSAVIAEIVLNEH